MYKKNDYIVYKKYVCKVREIRKNKMNGKAYYILVPITDDSLTIEVPVDNRMGYIRDIITKEDAEKLIKKIPAIEPLQNMDDKYIEKTYKELLYNGTLEDLIRIIKTTYLNNQERLANKKKLTETDKNYFELAEETLYEEFSVTLGKDIDATRKYVISKVENLVQ